MNEMHHVAEPADPGSQKKSSSTAVCQPTEVLCAKRRARCQSSRCHLPAVRQVPAERLADTRDLAESDEQLTREMEILKSDNAKLVQELSELKE